MDGLRSFTLFVTLMLLLSAAPAIAGDRPALRPSQPTDADVRKWFADLADADATVRDAALSNLVELQRADLPLLEQAVRQSRPLNPPQALALRSIVDKIYLANDAYDGSPSQGFLGIELEKLGMPLTSDGDSESVRNGVVVLRRLPGFCGARVLRDGDIILAVINRPRARFIEFNDFAEAVQSVGAGHVARFQILRRGRVIIVPITLDAHPPSTNPFEADELARRRSTLAEEYWNRTFAPLLKEGMS